MIIYQRFDKYVQVTSGCWIWAGAPRGDGYGAFAISKNEERPTWLPDRRQVSAHRFAFARAFGRWPELQVLHTCDTPMCVRPDHLYEGDNLRNVADKVERDRTTRLSRHGRARLTEEDVRALRAGEMTVAQAMRLRGVSRSAAQHARSGRNWSSLV